jgi:hypothetical protein
MYIKGVTETLKPRGGRHVVRILNLLKNIKGRGNLKELDAK